MGMKQLFFKAGNDFIEVYQSSENAFRDFGFADPDLQCAKATLAGWILKSLDDRKLSVHQAEAKTGVAHTEFTRIRRVKLEKLTLDRLLQIFGKLEPDVQIKFTREEPSNDDIKRR